MQVGEGTLILNRKDKEAGDGVVWYKALSPSLVRMLKNRHEHDCVCGQWLAIRGRIVWFKRTAKVPQYRPLLRDRARIGNRIFIGKFNED